MKITINEKVLRKYLSEFMSGPGWGVERVMSSSPVVASPVVDPSAAITDPANDRFKPKNRAELKAAMTTAIDKISDDSAAEFFNAVKDVLEDKEEKDKKMEKKIRTTESIVRAAVRKMLNEAGYDPNDPKLPTVKKIPYGVHGAEYMRNLEKRKSDLRTSLEKSTLGDDEEQVRSDEPAAGRERKNVMQTDVGGASFKQIAQELGYASESGAKQAAEKAMSKVKFASSMDPDALQVVVLTAMSDYIDFLNKSGELTPADVQLMKDHPNIVSELDGFREFLDKYIKREMKGKVA